LIQFVLLKAGLTSLSLVLNQVISNLGISNHY
jgi:hypothetical protein